MRSPPRAQPGKQPSEPPKTAQAAKPKDVKLDPGALSETLKAFAPFIDPNVNPAPPDSMDAAEQDVPQLDPQAVTTQPVGATSGTSPGRCPCASAGQNRGSRVRRRAPEQLPPLHHELQHHSDFFGSGCAGLGPGHAGTKISLRKTDATVGQLLTAVLDPLQLAPRRRRPATGHHPPAAARRRPCAACTACPIWSAMILKQLTQLADLIVETVDPSAWEAAGGPGVLREQLPSLVIQQRDTVLFRVLIFCERLRAARGLPPQSKFNPELFSLEPRLARAAPRLAKPVTLNFPQPAPFARILDRLSDESGVDILVDWPALCNSAGPSTPRPRWPPTSSRSARC